MRVFKVNSVHTVTGRGLVVAGECSTQVRAGQRVCFDTPLGESKTAFVRSVEKKIGAFGPLPEIGLVLSGASKEDFVCGQKLFLS